MEEQRNMAFVGVVLNSNWKGNWKVRGMKQAAYILRHHVSIYIIYARSSVEVKLKVKEGNWKGWSRLHTHLLRHTWHRQQISFHWPPSQWTSKASPSMNLKNQPQLFASFVLTLHSLTPTWVTPSIALYYISLIWDGKYRSTQKSKYEWQRSYSWAIN